MIRILFLVVSIFLVGSSLQNSNYTVDFYVGYLHYLNDTIQFEKPKLISTKFSSVSEVISLGKTKHFEFGIKVEVLQSKFEDTLSFVVAKAYYLKKADKWEHILSFCHSHESVNPISVRSQFKAPQYVWVGLQRRSQLLMKFDRMIITTFLSRDCCQQWFGAMAAGRV